MKMHRGKKLIVEMLIVSAALAATAEPFVLDINAISGIRIGNRSAIEWDGIIPSKGAARLEYGSELYEMASAPEGSITFEETCALVTPHLKQGGDYNVNEILRMRFYFGLSDPIGTEFYIEDKETIRKLMHGICDKILSSPNSIFLGGKSCFEEALSKYPLVPGDPPYLKEGETISDKIKATDNKVEAIPEFDQLRAITMSPARSSWIVIFRSNGAARFGYGALEMDWADVPKSSFQFEEIYNLLVPHLKQDFNYDAEYMDVGLFVGSSSSDEGFYLEDKETMRKIMHGLCDKVLASPDTFLGPRFRENLCKHPIVPGDPPYLKEGEELSNEVTDTEEETPVAAKKAGRPGLLLYVGAGVLVCVGAVLFFTRKK